MLSHSSAALSDISLDLIGVGRFLCDFGFAIVPQLDHLMPSPSFHVPLIPDCLVLPSGSRTVQLDKISLYVVGLEKIVEFAQRCGTVEASLFDSSVQM